MNNLKEMLWPVIEDLKFLSIFQIQYKLNSSSCFKSYSRYHILNHILNFNSLHRKHWREMIRHKREFLGAGHSNDWGDLIKDKVSSLSGVNQK